MSKQPMTTLDEHRNYFEMWFGDFLDPLPERTGNHALSLQETPASGKVVMMVTLPILERYMRGKSGLPSDGYLTKDHRKIILSIFPNLRDDDARTFWDYCRNGLLHQTTFKSEDLHFVAEGDAITLGNKPGKFSVNPRAFCKVVLAAIRRDFASYVAAESTLYRLPTVTVNQYTQEASTCVSANAVVGPREIT
jgi:hypothetical protein